MFFTRKDKSKSPRPSTQAAQGGRRNGFQPRVETLEGRALPSVSHWTLTIPVASVYGDLGVTYTIRIDFYSSNNIITSASYSLSETFRAPSFVSERLDSMPQNTVVTPVSAASNAVTQETGTAASLRMAPVPMPPPTPAPTAASSELAAFAITSSTPATRPVIRPTTPDLQPLLIGGLIDQLQLQPLTFSTPPVLPVSRLGTLDGRLLLPIIQPVQAISNRIEFLGGTGNALNNTPPDENPPDATPPQPRPANPPAPAESAESEDIAVLGGMFNTPLSQAPASQDAWVPDAMVLAALAGEEGAGQTLPPELLTEVATLAASLGTFAMVSPPRIPARRGSERGEMEIVLEKKKSRE
jgi:hypothetical protein